MPTKPPATPKFAIGDRVAYSVQFLKSIGMAHGYMATAHGNITALENPTEDWTLAHIEWAPGAGGPPKVNVANLAMVGPNRRFCNVD